MSANPLRVISVNVNGIRAAYRKGMGEWLENSGADIVALQEVRAGDADVHKLVGEGWHILHDEAAAKGRAGVALLSRIAPTASRAGLGGEETDSTGRWLEGDYDWHGTPVTVVSTYVHSGEVDTPRQVSKYAFLEAMLVRLAELSAQTSHAVVVGDLNVGHRELDIKNWKGNQKNAGFLPQERSYFDRFFGAAGTEVTGVDGVTGPGIGLVDVGRAFAGEVPGPYTWWSYRGQAFDNDAGWRIDYHMATPALAATVTSYAVERAAAYDERWSDHAPVTVVYAL
ncbi:exodeoxyribonuclease III [Mycetocola lacteus]|uniref:Exodeoxyribonuclease III n=1 Tax=Mycetocola lacteus TaxID=76637 RepID=A0A3L7AI17_9MICO|nr:exodeoxyribonuclease III [Mycetocola lacteus]RLP79867.1 exodeoxyribonuclease III [Mycetocola lacteus]